eukprot:g8217.t1
MASTGANGGKGTYSITSGTSWSIDLMPTEFPVTQLTTGEIGTYKTELLILALSSESFEVTKEEDGTETIKCISETLTEKDAVLNGALSDIFEKGDFKADVGQSTVVRVGGQVKNIGLFGLGKKSEISTSPGWGHSPFYKLGAQVASTVKSMKLKSISIDVNSMIPEDISVEATAQLIAGVLLGAYESTRYKESAKKSTLSSISLVNFPDGVQNGIDKGYAIAKGVGLAIYLVESPPNVCYPQHLADAATMIAEKFPSVFNLKILEKSDCEKLGMGLYLGVAHASTTPPKFIHLTYTKGTPKRDIALIGKGITFDSGGYNLKVGASMIEMMKMDMAGAGAVLGAGYILGELAPEDIRIHIIVASCENMISGEGYRPGDIITASNGKSVEILNTDAEGRLTLADALLYAQNECKATSVVNIATLTGAMMVALGKKIGGFFTPSESLAGELSEASKRTGDKVWRIPLEEEYNEELTKGIADLKNVGGRAGGAITAALFLKHFVKTEEVEWAHIDMAGPAWTEKGDATGFGANLLADWVIAKSKTTK